MFATPPKVLGLFSIATLLLCTQVYGGNDIWGGTDSLGVREVQIMLKHPNLNGMQMDPVTRFYTRAKFVKQPTIKYGGELVFDVKSGISISSDPNIRFTYSYGQKPFTATAVDTDNSIFAAEGELPGA